MIPDLNQSIDVYSQVMSYGGDSEITIKHANVNARVSLAEKFLKMPNGSFVQTDGFCWVSFAPDISRIDIIKFQELFYTVFSVEKTRGIDGNVLFQHITLKETKNGLI